MDFDQAMDAFRQARKTALETNETVKKLDELLRQQLLEYIRRADKQTK